MDIVYGALRMLIGPPATSCYSRTPIALDMYCTGSANRTCHLVRHLSAWNELLCQCGLQLHESPAELGRLCLVALDSRQEPAGVRYEWQRQASALVFHLMVVHRCVAELHVTASLLSARYIVSCLAMRCASSALRRLVVRSVPRQRDQRERCAVGLGFVLSSMKQLEEFVYQDRWCPSPVAGSLCALVRCSSRLRSLDVSAVAPLRTSVAAEFVQALRSNSTITELFLSTKIMDRALTPTRESMADYLCHNMTLRKLVFAAPSKQLVDTAELRSLVEPLFDNDVLEELYLSIGPLSAQGLEVIVELVARNNSLNVLFVRWDVSENLHDSSLIDQRPMREDRQPPPQVFESEVSSWASAFAGNRTLLELALDMSRLRSAKCKDFFLALAASETLRNVRVVGLPIKRLQKVLRVVRNAGTTLPTVHVENAHVSVTEVEALNEFEQVSGITVHSGNVARIHKALLIAPGFLYITHLRLFLHEADFDVTSHVLLARYLQATRILRELELVGHGYAEREDQADVTLVQALAVNKSIRSLQLMDLSFSDGALELLASGLRKSHTLCEFVFYPTEPEPLQFFLACLAPGFSTNYALVRLEFPGNSDLSFEQFHVEDVVRRNATLVSRAARFVVGASKERYCAEALEPVARSSALVDMVRYLAGLQNDDVADEMVREALQGLREMEDVLRVAGVVKKRIVCGRTPDGRLQLDDLNADCLRLIRQWLTLADIAVVSPDDDLVY